MFRFLSLSLCRSEQISGCCFFFSITKKRSDFCLKNVFGRYSKRNSFRKWTIGSDKWKLNLSQCVFLFVRERIVRCDDVQQWTTEKNDNDDDSVSNSSARSHNGAFVLLLKKKQADCVFIQLIDDKHLSLVQMPSDRADWTEQDDRHSIERTTTLEC